MATIADIGMVYAFHKDDKGDKKVVPEGETSNSTAASTSTSASASALSCVSVKQRMAVETTKLFGHMSACWVLATGVMTVASAIMIDINKSAALDELELLLNSTTSAKNNSTNNSTTDCKDEQLELTTIDYLNPVVFMCIGFLLAGLGLTIFFITESKDWDKAIFKKDVTAGTNKNLGVVDSVRFILTSPWLSCLAFGLIFVEGCQIGTISGLYFFMKYQFNSTATEFSLVLLWALFCTAVANTAGLKFFVKRLGLWPALYMSCFAGAIGLTVIGLAGQLGSGWCFVGISASLFNVAKPILRGKFCAEFSNDEQGKAQGCLYVALSFGGMLGTFLATSLLTFAIYAETGVEDIKTDCALEGERTLLSGLSFFSLSLLSLLGFAFALFAKTKEPLEDVANRNVGY